MLDYFLFNNIVEKVNDRKTKHQSNIRIFF